ncbi:MAG: AbrB/MazE/SpoVT family DNA-binding domain-containing protein [Nanoarchaeota archaeon]
MATDTVRMSSKGQVVIPQSIREQLGLDEGSVLAVAAEKNAILLKKVEIPSREELLKRFDEAAEPLRQRVKAMGLTESDVIKIALKHRKGHP